MLLSRFPAPRVTCSSLPAQRAATVDKGMLTAYVYSGPGAGYRSALSAVRSLREALVPAVRVEQLNPAQLLASGWQEGCLLLVMPGGADLPYCRVLNGRGNALIREYVEAGGAYLGLCAGAYYAAGRVEFEPGTRLEVVGDRELAFFPGIARGSAYPGFHYESEAGAAAALLQYRDPEQLQPLAAAAAAAEAAAATAGSTHLSTSGNGCSAAATIAPQQWRECRDYINGGPSFHAPNGSCLLTQPPPGVQVLASYPERGGAAAALLCAVWRGRVVLCGTHPELHPDWLEPCLAGEGDAAACSDRAQRDIGSSSSSSGSSSRGNGGGSSGAGNPLDGLAVLAGAERRQPASPRGSNSNGAEEAGSAAATAAAAGAAEPSAEVLRLRQVHAALVAGQGERWRYWRGLLASAGLADWLWEEDTGGGPH